MADDVLALLDVYIVALSSSRALRQGEPAMHNFDTDQLTEKMPDARSSSRNRENA